MANVTMDILLNYRLQSLRSHLHILRLATLLCSGIFRTLRNLNSRVFGGCAGACRLSTRTLFQRLFIQRSVSKLLWLKMKIAQVVGTSLTLD